MRPIIGVVARPYITDNGRHVVCILDRIRNAVIRAGGTPVLILPTQDRSYYGNKESVLTNTNKEILEQQINMCDGILMPGGDMIYFYDSYVCDVANKKDMPILGICMGMQVMCNYNNDNRNIKIENHKVTGDGYIHDVTIDKRSKLYSILNKDTISVNSLHGYMVPNSGDYDIAAKCGDIIEGIEKKDKDFNIGIQWHPEFNYDENDERIFDAFIQASIKYNDKKSTD